MKRLLWTIALAVLLPATFAEAQTTGRITGTVRSQDGTPLPGAEVVATALGLDLERTTVANERGEFQFGLLPTGNYSVAVTLAGMQPQVLTFDLGIGATVPLEVTLLPGETASESITVTGTATALETTQGGASFKYERQIDVLPVHDRRIESVASMAPNVAPGPNVGSLVIAGAPAYDTTVILDGAEISDPYFGSSPTVYLEDALEEVQVLTSGVSARYGRFQGGIINAITKTGTNEFKGALRAELQNDSWNAQTPFDEEQADDVRQGYQFTFGGPLVRDRAWFFAGLRQAPASEQNATTQLTRDTYTTTTEEDRYQGKLRAALTASHVLEASYLKYGAAISEYAGLPAGDEFALGQRDDPREVLSVSYQGILSPNAFVEVVGSMKDVSIENGGSAEKGDPFIDYYVSTVYHNAWWDHSDADLRNNETLSLTGTYIKDAGGLGSHNLEGGVQHVSSQIGGDNRQSSTGYNLLGLNDGDFVDLVGGEPRFNFAPGYMYRWVALPLGGEQTIDNTGVYVHDAISAGNWRFDLGLRYETYDGSGPLPEFSMDYDGLAPRLGATYSVSSNWQVQATYGRYLSRFNDNIAGNATGVGGGPNVESVYLGPEFRGLSYDQAQALLHDDQYWEVTSVSHPNAGTVLMANDVDSPYADEVTLSLRGALPSNSGTMVLTYTSREYRNLIEDYQGGICDYGLDIDRACPGANTTPILSLEGALLGRVDTIVHANDSRAKRDYDALTAVVDWRPNSQLQLGGNYTYATTKGNYEGEARNQPASEGAFGNQEAAKDLAHAAPYGYTDDDARHRMNVYGTYRLDMQRAGALTIGSLLRYQSGLPYSIVGSVPFRNIPTYLSDQGTYSHYFQGRGNRRFDDILSLDLSTQYQIPLFSRFNPMIEISARNVLNNDAVINHVTSVRPVYSDPSNPGPDTVVGFTPTGTCGLDDEPSLTCTGFGRIRNETDYQLPRTYLVTVGVSF